ncbi:MAG: flagellar hook-length control protein FliK, partial [Acetatifactor sp.]|nr:flagellar hook-length control protein FliK [Acetatifactor sp.]
MWKPETVNELVLVVAGAEYYLSLVMDENLYQSQQTITRGFQEITRQLKQDVEENGEELPRVLEKLENSVGGMEVHRPEAAENPLQSDTREHDRSEQDKGQDRNAATTGQVFYQNYTAQAQNQAIGQQISAMASAGESAYVEAQESRQIMNQVLDYMKVSMKPENTVLNMQLHPESLGTLHIQISAREGVMTAHFTASSEAVKTVLENQMAVLKENFLQQDIKVEAIEVTVETHQFEDNLEQGRQRNEEEAGRRPKRRRLDISSLESGEELTESEQIITEMMAADGNTVDYLA